MNSEDNRTNGRIVVRRHGGPEVLEWLEEPIPLPGENEVRVRLEAACANFTDVLVRRGLYPGARKLPVTPGYDFLGRVDAVGDRVSEWKVGDRVADLLVTGGYTEHLIREATNLVRVPESVDAAEAATLVLAWVTAYQLIHRSASVDAGAKVLVHAAGGAVGRAMLVLLEKERAEVYGTARAHHHDFLRSHNATPIDYTEGDWEVRASELVPDGYDVVFDSVGESGYRKSWRSVSRGGKLVAYGFTDMVVTGRGSAAAAFARMALWSLLPNGRRVGFYAISNRGRRKRARYSEDLSALLSMLDRGEIQPQVEDRLPLRDAPQAHRRIEAGGLHGKLVLFGPDQS